MGRFLEGKMAMPGSQLSKKMYLGNSGLRGFGTSQALAVRCWRRPLEEALLGKVAMKETENTDAYLFFTNPRYRSLELVHLLECSVVT